MRLSELFALVGVRVDTRLDGTFASRADKSLYRKELGLEIDLRALLPSIYRPLASKDTHLSISYANSNSVDYMDHSDHPMSPHLDPEVVEQASSLGWRQEVSP